MKKTLKILFLTCCISIISFAIMANPQWGTGVTVCAATGSQGTVAPPVSVPDGAGGTIFAWMDSRSGTYDVYCGKVDSNGNTAIAGWTNNGVAVCTATGLQQNIAVCSDGAGGIILAWSDNRGSGSDIYAQWIDSSGAARWQANGVTACVDVLDQINPAVVSDGAGGAIICWQDDRNDGDLYAQRITSGGGAAWSANGNPVCTATGDISWHTVKSAPSGGIYISWQDLRPAAGGIYAQHLNISGTPQWAVDGISVGGTNGSINGSSMSVDALGNLWVPFILSSIKTVVIQKISPAGVLQFAPGGITVTTSATAYSTDAYSVEAQNNSAIVVWSDDRSGSGSFFYDVYAQKIDSSGNKVWNVNGVIVCDSSNDQNPQGIISDGAGGAIISFYDSSPSSFVQKIDTDGIAQWTANGIQAAAGTSNFGICKDDAGGVICAWGSNVAYDLYAQRFWSATAATPTFTPSPTATFTATQTPVPVIAPGWVDADGTGVEAIVVSSLSGVSQTVNVQADSAGRANVLFGQNFGSGDRMYFLKWNGSSWTDVDGTAQESAYISTAGSYINYFSFVFDSLENPCLAWATGDPYYMKWNGSLWVDADGAGTESMKVTVTANFSGKSRLGLDNSGNPLLSWCEGMPSLNDVWFLKWNGTVWTDADGLGQEAIAVTTTAGNSEYVNMAIDASGNPHVVWSEQGSWKLQYLKWNGSEWVDIDGVGRESAEIAATTSSSVSSSIVIDGSGEAHIAWKVGTTNTQICYLKSMAGIWVDADGTGTESKIIATFSPQIGSPKLALDGMYRPHVAYSTLNGSDYDVSYIRWNGSAWVDADGTGRESETVYNSGGKSWNTDLDIDASGTAHLAWQNEETGQLMYLKYPNAGAPAATPTFTPTYTYTLTFSPTSTATQTPTPGVCNIGKLTTTGTYSFVSPNWTGGSVFAFGTGNLSEIRVNLLNAIGNVTAAVYDATGISGMAGNLIATSASQPAAAGWNILAISGAIAAPGNYWIMIQLSGATNQWDSQAGVTASGCIADCSTYGNWPAVLSPNGPTDAQMSVYAVMSSCNSTPVITSTYTYTRTPTITTTRTQTPLETWTGTMTMTRTQTPLETWTGTMTMTRTQTPLQTWTGTMTPTATVTQTPVVVPVATAADVPDEETYAGPNPSKDFVYLSYRIPKNANLITIEVYNFAGYKVAKVEDASITAGFYRIRLSLDKFASGVYYYIIKADYSDGEHVKFKPSKFLVAH